MDHSLPQVSGCDTHSHVHAHFVLDFAPHSSNISKQGSLKVKGPSDWALAVVIACDYTREA